MAESPFFERDISWLSFNHRVLQEAADHSVPLYERLKFLAIYSSNLDEFFRVRVASLRSFRKLAKSTKKEMALKPRKLLKQIRQIVHEQQTTFGRIFRTEILKELEANKIFLINQDQFSPQQQSYAFQFFKEKIRQTVRPIYLTKDRPELPFLENKALYFVVQFEPPEQPLALVKIPSAELGRFHLLPDAGTGHFITFLDEILRHNLSQVFDHQSIKDIYSIKISRDAELYIDDEYTGDLVEKIRQGLQERHIGLPTRFLYDSAMPEDVLMQLKNMLQLNKNDLIPGARHHNFNDFFAFPDPENNPAFHDVPMPPLPHPDLAGASSILQAMSAGDRLLHFPYQRYDYVLQLVQEAANDPQVEAIKITLYRIASQSGIAEGLLKALENGKNVSVFIEAKARFDEETNLFWGEKLAKSGALVRYSYPGIKVHTKLLLISRREEGTLRHFAYLGTGNFNEKTARLYADHALLTADARLADETAKVFDLLEGKLILPKCKNLLVAPFHLRDGFEKWIDREIANARQGLPAWMLLKMNSLEDQRMMEKLIEASQAGVKISMIVRGICCLKPGVEGFTDNIKIISILDRFLEHARVYFFANGGDEKLYLASADWMSRNLERRVEVAFPVFDEKLKREIRQIVDLQWNDNVKARIIDKDQSNRFRERGPDETPLRSQAAIYDFLKK